MIWFALYILTILAVSPVMVRYTAKVREPFFRDRAIKNRYCRNEAQQKQHDERMEFFLGTTFALIWPCMFYMFYVRYGAKFPEWREQKRVAVQQQRELELQEAYRMVDRHKKELVDNFDNALDGYVGGVQNLQRKVERGRV